MTLKRTPVLIVAAVKKEVAGLISRLKEVSSSSIGGRTVYEGFLEQVPARVAVTGPGLVNVVQGVTALIEDHRPKLIVNTGCAGVFQRSGLSIGDIGVASVEIDVHLGLDGGDEDPVPAPLPFTVVRHRGVSYREQYPLDTTWSERAITALAHSGILRNVRIKAGPFITVSTITGSSARSDLLWHRYHPVMEAMEGSGVAHLALHYDIPAVEIRAASNVVGPRDVQSWNLDLACQRASQATDAFISALPEFRFLED